jgi:hypothetical protein
MGWIKPERGVYRSQEAGEAYKDSYIGEYGCILGEERHKKKELISRSGRTFVIF